MVTLTFVSRSLVIVRYGNICAGWVWDVTGVHGLALYYRYNVHSDSLCIDFELLCVYKSTTLVLQHPMRTSSFT